MFSVGTASLFVDANLGPNFGEKTMINEQVDIIDDTSSDVDDYDVTSCIIGTILWAVVFVCVLILLFGVNLH